MIIFDIDGTLRDEKLGIPTSTKEAIQQCHNRGIRVGLCTGRTLSMIHNDVLDLSFDMIMSGDGSQIIIDSHTIQDLYFDYDLLLRILSSVDMNKQGISIETKHQVYMNQQACHILKECNQNKGIQSLENEKIIYSNNIQYFNAQTMPVSKICIWSNHKMEKRTDVQYVQCIENDHYYYEMIHCLAGKGQAIENVIKYLEIEKEHIICFGDGLNDISMFQACGYSIAMENSVDELKAIADDICPVTYEDGIYKELIKLKIIEGEEQ
ncbi:MAG: Cof-type HAD-IIB family hydrolase [Coprobacillus sp.]